MSTTIQELYRIFSLLNQHLFNNELPEVQIAVMETARKNAYGWFTPSKVWTDAEGTIERHEIALSAEYLNLKQDDYYKIVETLLHEMIHLYCHVNNIKDTSRQGRYHNKKFKEACEQHGMYFEQEQPDSSIGWSFAILDNHTKELIESWNNNENAFKIARKQEMKIATKPSHIKYESPSCD